MKSSADSAADDAIRVICGPTAGGKSALAMALAEHVPLAVISADSRQLYRGFDIGTAKPSAAERARVPHFGIDVVDPTARYSAAAWARAARGWIADAEHAGRAPVVVGGTGFYIRALVAPLFEEPVLDPHRRRALAAYLAAQPTTELRRWCTALDPARAGLGRAQLSRAIEIALLTGVPMSAWHRGRGQAAAPAMRARYLVVDPGPALEARVTGRIAAMLDAGWESEVRHLDATVPDDAPAWNATGYASVRAAVRGEITRTDAVAAVARATRQYAKRQRTWLRHQLPRTQVTTIDPGAPDALERALAWWRAEDDADG